MSDDKIHPVLDEEKPIHERMANLPDIPELPECRCQTLAVSHNAAIPPKKFLCLVCSAFQEINITREEYATMRAAVERERRIERASDRAQRVELLRELRAEGRSKETLEVDIVVLECEIAEQGAAVERCAELEAALDKVTSERDAARACAVEIRDSLHDEQSSVDELLRKKT